MRGVIIQSNGEKKVKYNNGKILEDWEAIKLLVKDMDKLNPNLFIMNLEALAFCEYDFGRIPRSLISIPIKLAEFWKGNINEDKLDDFFSMALEYRGIIIRDFLLVLDNNKHFNYEKTNLPLFSVKLCDNFLW